MTVLKNPHHCAGRVITMFKGPYHSAAVFKRSRRQVKEMMGLSHCILKARLLYTADQIFMLKVSSYSAHGFKSLYRIINLFCPK